MNRNDSSVNVVALVLVLVGAVLWFIGPFTTVSLLTIGNPPTALEIVRGDVMTLLDITETDGFLCAVSAGAGLILCLVCILFRSAIITRVAAALAVIPMAMNAMNILDLTTEPDEILGLMGYGFLGIAAVFLMLVFIGGRMKK